MKCVVKVAEHCVPGSESASCTRVCVYNLEFTNKFPELAFPPLSLLLGRSLNITGKEYIEDSGFRLEISWGRSIVSPGS